MEEIVKNNKIQGETNKTKIELLVINLNVLYYRTKVPPRPAGQRTEPEPQGNVFQSFGFGDGGFHLSFGIGAFPFGFFASNFNFTEGRPGVARPQGQQPGTPQFEEDQYLSKVFLWVALVFITWLILA